MKFSYRYYGKTKLGQEIIRPVIPVTIKNGERKEVCNVLVDSGADSCVFDLELMKLLDLNPMEAEIERFAGVTGDSKTAYTFPIELEVGGWSNKCKVSFAPGLSHAGYGVVGQIGFFEFFKIQFDYSSKETEIKLKRKR